MRRCEGAEMRKSGNVDAEMRMQNEDVDAEAEATNADAEMRRYGFADAEIRMGRCEYVDADIWIGG
jgi:hypothetical protein